jgi:hypothetical protein
MTKKNSRKITYNKMVAGRKKKKTKRKRKHRGGASYYNYLMNFIWPKPIIKPEDMEIYRQKLIDFDMIEYILDPKVTTDFWFASQSSLDVILSNDKIGDSVKEWLNGDEGRKWFNTRKAEEEEAIATQMKNFLDPPKGQSVEGKNDTQMIVLLGSNIPDGWDKKSQHITIPHPKPYYHRRYSAGPWPRDDIEKTFSVNEWLISERGQMWLKSPESKGWMNTIYHNHFEECLTMTLRSRSLVECLKIEIGGNTWIKQIKLVWNFEYGWFHIVKWINPI